VGLFTKKSVLSGAMPYRESRTEQIREIRVVSAQSEAARAARKPTCCAVDDAGARLPTCCAVSDASFQHFWFCARSRK
jgi:hypothetical protein